MEKYISLIICLSAFLGTGCTTESEISAKDVPQMGFRTIRIQRNSETGNFDLNIKTDIPNYYECFQTGEVEKYDKNYNFIGFSGWKMEDGESGEKVFKINPSDDVYLGCASLGIKGKFSDIQIIEVPYFCASPELILNGKLYKSFVSISN